jgi:hypothetical protein
MDAGVYNNAIKTSTIYQYIADKNEGGYEITPKHILQYANRHTGIRPVAAMITIKALKAGKIDQAQITEFAKMRKEVEEHRRGQGKLSTWLRRYLNDIKPDDLVDPRNPFLAIRVALEQAIKNPILKGHTRVVDGVPEEKSTIPFLGKIFISNILSAKKRQILIVAIPTD